RLSRAVDAEDQYYRRWLRCTCERRRRRAQLLDDEALQAHLIDLVDPAQPFDGLVRRGNAEVRLDQHALHCFELEGVDRAAAEEPTDLLPESHQGSPWRRRSAHSVASAAIV